MKNLLKHIQTVNSVEKMWTYNDIIVLGVSGGSDSMSLMDIFNLLKKKKYIKEIIVAHVNYNLRGKDSIRDEKIVREFAKKINVPIEVLSVSKNAVGKNENDWRNIRYDFFVDVFKKYNADAIALAHNKNDQAETLLLNLFRGSGLEGLRGMSYKNNKIIRPLLKVTKDEIREHCKKRNIEYSEDYTNKDTIFLRNKIRVELLPYLEKEYKSNIIDLLSKTAFILAQDYDSLENKGEIWTYSGKKAECDREEFLKLSIGTQRRELRNIIKNLTESKYKKSFNAIEEYRKTILSDKNKSKVILNNNLKFEQKNGKVKFMLV